MSKAYINDNLERFAKEYVEAGGSSFDEVTLRKGNSLLDLYDITGCTCTRTERPETGYEIMEFHDPEKDEKILLMQDRMCSAWVLVV